MRTKIKVKVVCINLWLGGVFMDRIIDFLRTEDADLVLMQEVFDGKNLDLEEKYHSLSVLQEALEYDYIHFAPAFLETIGDGQKIEQGNAIFSKFPLSGQKTYFYDVPFGDRLNGPEFFHITPRNLQHVVASVAGVDLHVLNTQGIWGTHGGDTQRRLEMGDFIAEIVRDKKPLVLAGDINVNPNTKTIRKIETQLESVFGSELVTTFNISRKNLEKDPGYATSAVDMMFISKDVTLVSKDCPQIDLSDHLPLVATIEV